MKLERMARQPRPEWRFEPSDKGRGLVPRHRAPPDAPDLAAGFDGEPCLLR